jgi:hypothetical protein
MCAGSKPAQNEQIESGRKRTMLVFRATQGGFLMATYDASVKKALTASQQDLIDHKEHCSAIP